MPDMKRFLDRNSATGRVMLIVVMVFGVIFSLVMLGFMISSGFDLFMLPMVMPFLVFSGVCFFLFRRSSSAYPLWWNSLSEGQRSEIEQDYSSAEPVNDCLILGRKFAFIRGIGMPIPYDEIDGINFVSVKGGWNMFVVLNDGRKMVTLLPPFCDRQMVWTALMQRCGKDVSFY